LAGKAIETGEIQESRNVRADPRFGEKGLAARYGLVSALSVPIVADGRPFGALNYYAGIKRSFSEFERHALQAICGIAGMAVVASQTERRRVEHILDAIGTGVTLVGLPPDWAERRRRYEKHDPAWNLNLQMPLLYINKRHQQYAPHAKVGDICYKAFNTPEQNRPCWWCPTLRAMLTGQPHTSFTHSPAPPKERLEHFEVTASILPEAGRPIAAIESTIPVTRELEGWHCSARLVELTNEEEVFRVGAECLGRGYHADRIAWAQLVDGGTLTIERVYTVNRREERQERKAYSPWTRFTPKALPPVEVYFRDREDRGQWLFERRSRHPDAGRQVPPGETARILATIKTNRGVAVLEEMAIPPTLRAMALFSNAQKALFVRLGARDRPWGCIILVHEKPPEGTPALTVATDPIERESELHWCAEVCNEIASKAESVRLSKSLEEVAAQRKTLIEKAPVGVLTINRDGIVTSANPAWQEMSGGDPTERNVFKFESLRRAGLVGKLRAALRGEGFELRRTRFRTEWGKELVVSARCVPLRKQDRVNGLLLTCWDMSAIAKEYDQLMKNLELVTLGRLAAGAVHEIASPARAVDYAEQGIARVLPRLMAFERRMLASDFSGQTSELLRRAANAVFRCIAHDAPPLPQPEDAEIAEAKAVLGQSRTRYTPSEANSLARVGLAKHLRELLGYCDTPTARQRVVAYLVSLASSATAINDIKHSIPRIKRMVEALEGHAFVESGRRRPANLHHTIDAAALLLQSEIEDVDTELERRYSTRVSEVSCVPGQLIQMWRNLLQNSLESVRKARRKGHIRVTTRARGRTAVVTISDNGVGIPPEVDVKALGTTLPDIAPGEAQAYGLWIVREIVKNHRARFRVRRIPEGGTTVTVALPVGNNVS
jgi:PAS domain S-box-containing protein